MNKSLLRKDCEGLCTLTINRPQKHNALDTGFFEELNRQLESLEQSCDRIGCVVLQGAGRSFCAGADLAVMGSKAVPPEFKPGVIERLEQLTVPVIAAVHGVCFTGGLELALACDFIVADSTARFADTHGRWGLVGQWGISQRLPRRIGGAAAKKMMMTSREVSGVDALAMGLVDELAEEGELETVVQMLAKDILANSWFTSSAVKKLLRDSDGMSLAKGLAHERDRHPGFAPDYQQRIDGFKNKK